MRNAKGLSLIVVMIVMAIIALSAGFVGPRIGAGMNSSQRFSSEEPPLLKLVVCLPPLPPPMQPSIPYAHSSTQLRKETGTAFASLRTVHTAPRTDSLPPSPSVQAIRVGRSSKEYRSTILPAKKSTPRSQTWRRNAAWWRPCCRADI